MIYKYISNEGLDNLKQYSYHCNDRSILAKYVMQRFWNKAVTFLPIWIAPNLVTLLGFFGILASYLVMAYYNPQLNAPIPNWAYIFAALCLFWYQTMDAIDGKQARRTKSSSPLGELFDHGCDSMTTTLMGLTLAGVFQVGSGVLLNLIAISSYSVFFATQWEEYHTGQLDLGIVNVTEIQIFTMIVYIAATFLEPNYWLQTFEFNGTNYQYLVIPCVIIFLGSTLTLLGNIINVSKLKKGVASFSQLYPMLMIWISAACWYYNSTFAITHPHLFLITIGFLFSYITGVIVTKRVCGEKFPLHYFIIYLFFFISNYRYWGIFVPDLKEEWLYFGMTTFSVLQYLYFASIVINQMTTHLKIRCFVIAKPNKQ